MDKQENVGLAVTGAVSLAVSLILARKFHGVYWRDQPWWAPVLRAAASAITATCVQRFGDQRHALRG